MGTAKEIASSFQTNCCLSYLLIGEMVNKLIINSATKEMSRIKK